MVLLIPILIVSVMILASGFRPPSDREIDHWIEAYGAPTDGAMRRKVFRHLANSRRFRFSFALAGFLAASMGRSSDSFWTNPWLMLLAGYLVGSIVAEMAFGSPDRSRTPTAALVPRTVGSYLPRYATIGLVVIPLVNATIGVWQMSVVDGVPRRFGLAEPMYILGPAIIETLIVIVAIVSIRAVVRRQQPADSLEAVALDDAFRSSSIHAIAGAALTLALLLLAYTLGELNAALTALGSPFATAPSVAAIVAVALALASWLVVRQPGRWRSRRSLLPASAARST